MHAHGKTRTFIYTNGDTIVRSHHIIVYLFSLKHVPKNITKSPPKLFQAIVAIQEATATATAANILGWLPLSICGNKPVKTCALVTCPAVVQRNH